MPAIASELRHTRGRLERWAMRERPARSRRWLPRPTVRLRLTILYGTLFLVAGALLLATTYGLVAQSVGRGAGQQISLRDVATPVSAGGKGALFFQQSGG